MGTMNDAKTLEELILAITAQRERLADAVSATQTARENETDHRNKLNALQKQFDEQINNFKKDSRDHDTAWQEQQRRPQMVTTEVGGSHITRVVEEPEDEVVPMVTPRVLDDSREVLFDSVNGATKKRG